MCSNSSYPPDAQEGEPVGRGDITASAPRPPRMSRGAGYSRWRGHTGLRTVLYLAAVLLVGAMVFLATTPGEPSPSADAERETTSETHDRSITTGLDNPGEVLDQPIPVPSRDWRGWDRYSSGRCAWMPPGLLDPLAPTGPPRPTSTGCAVPISGGGTVFVNWGPPQKRLLWYTTRQSNRGEVVGELITVAGLEARTTKPFFFTVLFPGICRVDVNTRSLTGLSILAWNPPATAHGCDVAATAANLVARAVIPAAGGTPWPDTPQQPALVALVGRGPCELLAAGVSALGDLNSGQIVVTRDDSAHGCELAVDGGHVQAWLTPVDDAGRRPEVDGATDRRLGPLSAWEKDTATSCTITTEVIPGQLLAVSYQDSGPATARCAVGELITATAVQTILDESGS